MFVIMTLILDPVHKIPYATVLRVDVDSEHVDNVKMSTMSKWQLPNVKCQNINYVKMSTIKHNVHHL
jgi:hypothetical protein